ncbi:hypothetical protein TX25_05980 [Pseudomonas lactis]|nr:hypothetical protein TX25_05980 [Pseudomonas lactis]
MTTTSTGKLSAGVLEFLAICDQCQRPRNTGNHTKCSKIRQRIHAAHNQQSNSARSMQRGDQ